MNNYEKAMLVNLIDAIDNLSSLLASVETEYGSNLTGMYVENKELGQLSFNIDMVDNELGNVKDYVRQYIKEEEEYEVEQKEG